MVLTDVRVCAGPVNKGRPTVPVKLRSASANFSQQGFPIANAIDGDATTGWAIHPEVGKPHTAVFAFEKPLEATCSKRRAERC
jgi:hypothetical protein